MYLSYGDLLKNVAVCDKCSLYKSRKHIVIGEGNLNSVIMFVGEGPGEVEDNTGRPFVGPAGQLLDKMLSSIGLQRNQVYICNIVKCRPPKNRVPLREEIEACIGYLKNQVVLIKPKIIVCLGSTAAKEIINDDFRITQQHGEWIERKGYYLIATFHPSALLRDPSKKLPAWQDFKKIRVKLKDLE